VIKQLPNSGQVSFHRRLGGIYGELLNVCCNRDRLDFIQTESVIFAPIEELLYRPRICHPGITIPDGRGKKLDEAPSRALAVGDYRRWQRVYPRAHERRRWRNLVSENDWFFGIHAPSTAHPFIQHKGG
jgi:hypothetical protein